MSTASWRPIRWLVPPPQRTAHFSAARRPGVVLRVSRMTARVPATASTYRRVSVAMPDEPAQQVERQPLPGEHGAGAGVETRDGAGVDRVPVGGEGLPAQVGVERLEHLACEVETRHHAGLPQHQRRARPRLWRDDGFGGPVAVTHVLGEPARDVGPEVGCPEAIGGDVAVRWSGSRSFPGLQDRSGRRR